MESPDTSAQRRDYSVSMQQANLYALVTGLLPAALLTLPFFLIRGSAPLRDSGGFGSFWMIAVAFIVGVVVHELIHGAAWMLAAGKNRGKISFGFQWKTLTPYAHCDAPMPARAYRIGAAAPGMLMGLLPLAAAYVTGSLHLLVFGFFFTLAAGGDFLILWTLRKVPPHWLVEDHPTRAGCYVYEETAV